METVFRFSDIQPPAANLQAHREKIQNAAIIQEMKVVCSFVTKLWQVVCSLIPKKTILAFLFLIK